LCANVGLGVAADTGIANVRAAGEIESAGRSPDLVGILEGAGGVSAGHFLPGLVKFVQYSGVVLVDLLQDVESENAAGD
jgi:hypothetical protein